MHAAVRPIYANPTLPRRYFIDGKCNIFYGCCSHEAHLIQPCWSADDYQQHYDRNVHCCYSVPPKGYMQVLAQCLTTEEDFWAHALYNCRGGTKLHNSIQHENAVHPLQAVVEQTSPTCQARAVRQWQANSMKCVHLLQQMDLRPWQAALQISGMLLCMRIMAKGTAAPLLTAQW